MDVIPEQDEPHVDRAADAGDLSSGSARSTAASSTALMLLVVVVHPREEFERWAPPSRPPRATIRRRARAGSCSPPSRASTAILSGGPGQWGVRSRPHAPDVPVDDRRGGGPQHAREPPAWVERPRHPQARRAHAGHEALASTTSISSPRISSPSSEERDDECPVAHRRPPGRGQRPRRALFERLHDWVVTVDHKRLGIMYVLARASSSSSSRAPRRP